MLLSMVTVTCPGTFVGAERVEGGAGAMGRLGMVGFKGGFISPSEKESGTAGVKCAGGAVTVTGAPDWTGWCCVSIWTCGYGRTTTGSCFSSRGWMEPLGPMCSLGATSGSRLDSSLTVAAGAIIPAEPLVGMGGGAGPRAAGGAPERGNCCELMSPVPGAVPCAGP